MRNKKGIYLATEAESIGYGGKSQVSRISGVSRVTITRGKQEKERSMVEPKASKIRKKGGGRKKKHR